MWSVTENKCKTTEKTNKHRKAKQNIKRMAAAVNLHNLRYNSSISKFFFKLELFEFHEHDIFETGLTSSLEY